MSIKNSSKIEESKLSFSCCTMFKANIHSQKIFLVHVKKCFLRTKENLPYRTVPIETFRSGYWPLYSKFNTILLLFNKFPSSKFIHKFLWATSRSGKVNFFNFLLLLLLFEYLNRYKTSVQNIVTYINNCKCLFGLTA